MLKLYFPSAILVCGFVDGGVEGQLRMNGVGHHAYVSDDARVADTRDRRTTRTAPASLVWTWTRRQVRQQPPNSASNEPRGVSHFQPPRPISHRLPLADNRSSPRAREMGQQVRVRMDGMSVGMAYPYGRIFQRRKNTELCVCAQTVDVKRKETKRNATHMIRVSLSSFVLRLACWILRRPRPCLSSYPSEPCPSPLHCCCVSLATTWPPYVPSIALYIVVGGLLID